MIEKKIAEHTAVSEQMPQEIDALLHAVTVLVARRLAARISGPVTTDVTESIYAHSEKIQALSSRSKEAVATPPPPPHRDQLGGRCVRRISQQSLRGAKGAS